MIFCRLSLVRLVLALTVLVGLAVPSWGQVTLHAGTTRKVLQLTNNWDTTLRRPTRTASASNTAIGTDLGSSFIHNGQLWFAFGDTAGAPGWGDVLGKTTATRISELNNLTFRKNPDNSLETIDVPGITEVGMEVPSGAIDVGGSIYIVQTTSWDGTNMRKSVLARSTNDGDTWTNVYTLSDGIANINNAHFINVSLRKVNAADYPGLLPWSSGDVILIWGAGAYRASNPYLAAIPAASIGTKSAMRYVSGINGSNVPTWSTSETAAVPLFVQPNLGEFSCSWIPQQNCWLMLYNSPDFGTAARGIMMRSAPKPWGPWSAPSTLMTAGEAYGQYMHISWNAANGGHFDRIQDYIVAGDNDWGGEYGGYLIDSFTTGDSVNTQIYYVVSTWNPYQAVVMMSEIGPSGITFPTVSGTQTLTVGDASWSKSSTTFYGSTTVGGIPGITTWTGSDVTTGLMWRFLPRDRWNKTLTFNITSGNGEVILLDGNANVPTAGNVTTIYNDIKAGVYGDVLKATWGHEDNGIVIPVTWDLTPYDRANLKVVVIDYSTGGWSFHGVSNMTLTRTQPPTGTNTSTVMPGDAAWTKTSGTWFGNFTRNGIPHVTTFGPSGDANVGVMWRMLPRDWKNKQLDFTYHGGHGRILLLQGGDPIPTSGTFATIQSDILAGKYGKVIKSIVGPENNGVDLPVSWLLDAEKSDDMKVVVIDSETGPWSFVSVSQMTLTRFN